MTDAVEWMWINAYLPLFGLNMLILVTVETVSRLLGLMCWRFIDYYLQLPCLAVRWLLTMKKIESRNRFGDLKKLASICL